MLYTGCLAFETVDEVRDFMFLVLLSNTHILSILSRISLHNVEYIALIYVKVAHEPRRPTRLELP